MGILKILRFIFVALPFLASAALAASPSTLDGAVVKALTKTDGSAFTPNAEKKKLVYFWATWCPSCRQKFQNGDLAKIDAAPGVELLAVNTDKELDRAKNFLDKAKPPFRVLRDPTKALTNALEAKVAPFWAVIELDPQSKAWKVLAAEEGADLEKMHKALGI